MKQMEHKQFDAIITAIDEPQGIVKAVFSVFGNVDYGGDRIHAGAFAKTFAERGTKVLILDNHNSYSTGDVIAKVVGLRELTREQLPSELQMKYPEATGGAELTAKFEPDNNVDAKSAAAFFRLKNGWIGEWSFGYDALDFDFEAGDVGGKSTTVRNLRTVKLYEVSPVLWGMNGATMTTDAKADYTVDAQPSLEPDDVKAGAVLSKLNIAKLMTALQTITDVLKGAGAMDSEDDIPPDEFVITKPDPNPDYERDNLGPLAESKTAPTTDVAGPQETETPDYLKLIEINRQRLSLLEV